MGFPCSRPVALPLILSCARCVPRGLCLGQGPSAGVLAGLEESRQVGTLPTEAPGSRTWSYVGMEGARLTPRLLLPTPRADAGAPRAHVIPGAPAREGGRSRRSPLLRAKLSLFANLRPCPFPARFLSANGVTAEAQGTAGGTQ